MSKNYINVSVSTSKPTRVSVSAPANQQNIDVTRDTSAYNAELAKQWATAEGLVLSEDYSSKYYANKSKESANTAKGYLESTREIHNNFASDASSYINALTELKETGAEEINEAVASGKDEITSTKTTILQDIEFVADGEKKEIQDLADNAKDDIKSTGFYMRDDKLYFINSEGEEQEFKSGGGGGLEIGDIGFTQMAIDETKGKRRVLNGQVIIQEQYQQFTQIVKDSVALNADLACTESEWQTAVTMSTNGVCEKFVIDDSAGTIRLPKYPTYLDLTNNATAKSLGVSVYGNGMTLGITNGTGYYGVKVVKGSNQLNHSTGVYAQPVGSTITTGEASGGNTSLGVTTDPARSGLSGSVTIPAVTSEKIKGQYFIQVATGVETEDNIINEIELNNPYSLGDSKYSPTALNNLSWLKSEGQWNSKAVYPSYYEWLLKIYNGVESVAGVSVKLSTESYTDYDFVINTTDETFRLPLLDGSECLPSDKYTLENNFTVTTTLTDVFTASANGWYIVRELQSSAGTLELWKNRTIAYDVFGIGDSTHILPYLKVYCKKGDVISAICNSGTFQVLDATFRYATGNGSLYFYVGETVQNANLINAGRIEETLVKKVDMQQATVASMPSNKYIDLTLGASGSTYTAPANGWFVLSIRSANDNGASVHLSCNNIGMQSNNYGSTGAECKCYVPALKGEQAVIFYNNVQPTPVVWRFYYAQGEV